MRPRNTIIALVVLLLIGGYALTVSFYSKPEETQKLFKVSPDDIAKIELRYPDRDLVIERKKGGTWRITKPIGAEADQTTADNLAHAIAECEITRTVEEKPTDLAPFGLGTPQTVVTVTTFDNKKFPGIEIGKLAPVGFSAYIKTTDKPAVMLTSSGFPPGMNKTLDQLRNRELMTFKVGDVQKLTLQKDTGAAIEVDREGDNWKIVKPVAYPADSTQVRQLLSTLVNAKVADFVSDAPANVTQYGLETPHLTVVVNLGNLPAAQQSLLFGFKQTEQGKDGVYVRRGESAPIYTVHQFVMSGVDKSVLDLRDKTVLNFDPSIVASAIVKSASGAFALRRGADGKWSVVESGKPAPNLTLGKASGAAADAAVVERFLDEMRELKGVSIIADPMPNAALFGLDNPAVDITLMGKDGKPIGELKLAKLSVKPAAPLAPNEPQAPSVEYYATATPGKAVYSLTDFSFSELNKTDQEFLASPPPASAPSAAAN
jgi:hypothetical protein